jgi:glyoxylase-like metal-dependent hydrolase (beta-lactamase superfamily II)
MLIQPESPAPAPAAVSGTSPKLRQLLRKRLRQLLRITLSLAICLALAAAAFAIWWLTSLNGLPDIGDPFDVAAFHAFSVPDNQNPFTFLRRAEEKLTPSRPSVAISWSQADAVSRQWVEANRQAIGLFQQGAEQSDAANPAGESVVNVQRLALLVLLEGDRQQERGDTAGAWDCHRAVLRIITHIRRRGSLHQRFDVNTYYSRWLLQRLAIWAADPRTTTPQLHAAVDEVLRSEPNPEWDAFYHRERGSLPPSDEALDGTYLKSLPDDGSADLDDGTAPTAGEPSAYEVYAVRYARELDVPVSELVEEAEPGRKLDIAMTFWVLKGPDGRTVLVDAGFHRARLLRRKGIADYTRPDKALGWLGIRPEEVTDVVVTHMHWDHADGIDLFPKAKVWIQKDEFNYYTREAKQRRGQDGNDDLDEVSAIVKLNNRGGVRLVDGDAREILPGVTVYTGGRHTFASQYVGVNTKAGRVVIASDNLCLYENLDKHIPIAQTFDAKSNLAA